MSVTQIQDENDNRMDISTDGYAHVKSIFNGGVAVTKSDTVNLAGGATKGLYIGGAGNVAAVMSSGTVVTLKALAVGVCHNISVTRVNSTDTTATDIVALYYKGVSLMNYGTIKTMALRLLDEYGTNGILQTSQDVLNRIQGFLNDALLDLAVTTCKIPDKYVIAHNPLYNELSRDTSSLKKHLPGADFSVSLAGAKAYWFEANGPAVITVDELIGTVWTTLETITITADKKVLEEHKGLIAASSETNTIRINFSGPYSYDFVNYVLYQYPFFDIDSIQQNRPYFYYDLPTNFLELNFVEARKDVRQYTAYSNYKLRPDKIIAINRYDAPMEVLVHYWREPQLLTFTGNVATDDAQIIDTGLSPDGIQIIPYFIAANSLIADGTMSKGITLLNLYEQKKANLSGSDIAYSPSTISVDSW